MWMLVAIWVNGVPPDLARLGAPEVELIAKYDTETECKSRLDYYKNHGNFTQEVIFRCYALDN